MISPILNTFLAFAFTVCVTGWVTALLIDRCCGQRGISLRGLWLILVVALLAGTLAGFASWQRGEFRNDQTLEIDYQRIH